MINILFVHQSADMYGSDKALLSLIRGLNKKIFTPIVLIPCNGPLVIELNNLEIRTYILPLVRVARRTFRFSKIIRLPLEAWISVRAIDKVLKGTKIDIVHSNTVATLSGALWAWRHKVPHLWHVHEIIQNPKTAKRLFPWMVRILSRFVVTNSKATLEWLINAEPSISRIGNCIWNGVDRNLLPDVLAVKRFRKSLQLNDNDILVALVGRINRWKGQQLLIDALDILWSKGISNVYALIVGSPPAGQDHFKENLLTRIAASPAKARIAVSDFRDNIWTVWDACDIAVVPSTEPEPFGMVAIEAMASGKPVIAADHGGLREIVSDDITGFLISPGDAIALADRIENLSKNEALRRSMGERGKERQEQLFSLQRYIGSFESVYISATVCEGKT